MASKKLEEEEIQDEKDSNDLNIELITSSTFYCGAKEYIYLTQRGKIQVQYIWIGGNGNTRCKTRTVNFIPMSHKDLPQWNFDGSSTNQAPGKNSEIWLVPVKIVPDPFRLGKNLLCLCECMNPSVKPMKAIPSNKRARANKIFKHPKVKAAITWFGLEQEYTMYNSDGVTILGWPVGGYPAPQGPYYCGVGANRAFGRKIVEHHYRACLYANINISGCNAEVMPGQWEYQIGPCEGIDSGDQVWLSRFILERVAEEYNVVISFSPKPIKGDWNGAGLHTNYSTIDMRKKCSNKEGYNTIIKMMKYMKINKDKHMKNYGKGNENRLTGSHETQEYNKFSYGVADRGASIRIPRQTEIDGYGYFEDRRPAANADPYDVTSLIAETTILFNEKNIDNNNNNDEEKEDNN